MPCPCCAGQRTCADLSVKGPTLSFTFTHAGLDLRSVCGFEGRTPVNGCQSSFSVAIPDLEWYGGSLGWWSQVQTSSNASPSGINVSGGYGPPSSLDWTIDFYRCSPLPYGNPGPVLSVALVGADSAEWFSATSPLGIFEISGADPFSNPAKPRIVTVNGVSWANITDPYFDSVCFSSFTYSQAIGYVDCNNVSLSSPWATYTASLSGCD